ncbi:polycystin-1 [Mugil cephalus]|uniref:polycystin-1 n=1 Tax=Mugil cephalus TaxID=48193 RepID=UPI001FB7CD9E|nr:polycystin-1 [Mugil cephalus]
MTGALASPLQALLWILCAVLMTTSGEDAPCPIGGRIHLASLRCYWLSESRSSWFEARDSCRNTRGGDLASADSPELRNFIFYSFPVKTSVWVWLGGERLGETQEMCTQIALGTQGRWRKAQCAGRYIYLCESEVTESLPSQDSYLTGLVLMTGVYAGSRINPLPSVPDTGQHTVEMQLFPGVWFSHAGQLASVELVVQPSPVSSLARVQILRPYCNPNHHLVPPGCSSLLNPFSCCSAVPLCNTTGGCSMGQHWCHLLEACVPTTSPCSPYDPAAVRRGFALPPRYPALPPFYHLVADLPLRITPSSELKTLRLVLPERAIMVYPDDVVAIQHTLDSGAFLHCLNSEASLNSPWHQSYLSFRGTEWGGWLEGGLTSLPKGSKWVDGVVCDLRMMYVDTLHGATSHEHIFGDSHTETSTAPDIRPLTGGPNPSLRSKFRLHVIHPLPDANNQIHVQINIPTLIVVEALFGENARSSWSGPVLQTGVPFLQSCPEEVLQSSPGCEKQSSEAWFSAVTLVLPSVGAQVLNISVTDVESFESVSVKVCGYEAVTGLSVEPYGCPRMLIDTSQSFTAKVERGSSVKFMWVIDSLEEFAYEGESYSVMFKKPAEYNLQVTASNPVSSESQKIFLTADEVTPLAEPEFLSVREVVAVDAVHLYTVKVRVDISLPVTFRWQFGDGSNSVVHTQPAPCQAMEGHVVKGGKQVYVQDSVNHTYSIPGDYILHVHVSSQHDSTDTSMKINVRHQLNSLFISASASVLLVKQTFQMEASIEPSTSAVFYTWDFGDGSQAIRGIHRKVSHTFGSAGVYNVTVCASNNLTSLTAWDMVVVVEKISGLTVAHSAPREAGTVMDFKAKVASGSSLIWDFDFGDGSQVANLTDGCISHVYKLPGNYKVDVKVSNSVSQAHRSITVEVYRLTVSGVLPTECVVSGKDIQFNALVNGNSSSLTFHWLFGEDSPLTVAGQSTVTHMFPNHGIFYLNLTVFSSATSVSYSRSICVESPITNVEVWPSKDVVPVGEEVCIKVLISPEQITGYQFKWFTKSSGFASLTENSQKCFVFRDAGVQEVSVTASNKVSNKTTKTDVTIQEPVSQLSVMHDSQSDTLTVNTLVSFWVASCVGSNVSVLWDFGDGTPTEQKHNISHVFTSTGQFTVTATAFNVVSRDSTTLRVNVLFPVSNLSLHTSQPYAAVGEEILITAISTAISSTSYFWTIEGVTSMKQGTYEFRYIFPKAGVYQVKVIAQNLVSRREAAILIKAFERIQSLQIECQNLIDKKYVPAHEELLFIASFTRGSNVTYDWLLTQSGINRQVTADRKIFHVSAETAGSILVQLRASNVLSEATSSVSLLAVERVTSAHIAAQSNLVALGKVANISVFVDTGSDLHYLWYVNSDFPPLQTQEPFLLYTFSSLGHCLVKVSVQNVISQSNNTKEFLVQEEVQGVDFQIDSKKLPFYVNTSTALYFLGHIYKGSDLHWDWKVRTAKQNLFTSTNQTFIYSFPHAATYQVYVNVSNGINWQVVSHNVTAQDAIQGLMLNISKPSLCTEEQVTFTPTISKGSDVSYVITFRNKDWIQSQDISEGQFVTSSLPVGSHQVTVKALNQVSNAEASSTILVTEQIQGLQLVNCCSSTLEAFKGVQFKAEVQSGFPTNYTWIFSLEKAALTQLTGQEVTYTPSENGSLSFSLLASNGICSQRINQTAIVELPIKKVKLVCNSQKLFVGHSVRFSETVNEGSNVRYLWDFGDNTELLSDSSTINHTFYYNGKYTVTVKVLNDVSDVSTKLDLEVEELQCSSPQVVMVQSQSTIFRSRPSYFEASVDVNCTVYRTTYRWELFSESYCTNDNTDLSGSSIDLGDAASPFLLLPKHTLNVGCYCLVFTVSFQGTPLLVQRNTNITVVHSPLVAVIKGGSHRVWPILSDLVLDGSGSHDPDMEAGVEETLQYQWTWMSVNSTESPFIKPPIGTISSRMTILSSKLHPSTLYLFTVTVHKTGRTPASVNQTVTISEAPVLLLTVECVSCSALSPTHHSSHSMPVVLAGQCRECNDQAQYQWRAEQQGGTTLDLDEATTSTGKHSPNLVVRSGVLQPGQSYSFTLSVSQPDSGRWGSAILTIQLSYPPNGGLCDLSPESDIRLLETVVTYNCSGWQSDQSRASQLIYTFQATTCHPTCKACPVLTLYRGTRSTFSCLVPMGIPGQQKNTSVITVILLVEDDLGAKAVALNRTLTVENPTWDGVASQWLRNKSQTELWALVQHGNPQEIIPYSIALTSKLNQMEFGRTTGELQDKREVRVSVTQALVSLPVSSLLDVDQISSALSQSTAVPSELVCESCWEKVLESVRKMIHVIEEQTSPAVLPAVHTGRNILDVIGNTLAAGPESASASGSPPTYSDPLQTTSAVALSALGHAGTLMRTLMRLQVLGEEPLSLSTSYINTIGFQGDPSKLLCSHQSNISLSESSSADESEGSGPCQFHIPNSLTAHLKSERSEVVQVLFDINGAPEISPLLTAANPPISTSLVAMELTTPQGQSIPIQDLGPEQAIRVTLPNKYPVQQGDGGGDGGVGEAGNGTCLSVEIPPEGQLNFTVKALDDRDENAGLYISFNFSLVPGATPASLGHVKTEVSSAVPGTNASQDSLVREWALTLSGLATSSEETIFLSPLLNGTDKPLYVTLTSSLVDRGPVQVSVCVFSSLCRYYSVKESRWSSKGLQPLEGSTLHTAHCLTQHLTMFGASLFVHPGAVVLLPPSGGPMQNMVVGIVCAVLVLIHLLVGLIAHKLDHLDSLRQSHVPLCGRPGLYHYRVLVKTGWRPGSGTTAHVGISLYGVTKSGSRHLQRDGAFQRGSLDQFHVETDDNLGEVWKIRIWHDNTGLDPSWYVQHVVVWDPQTDHMFFFLLEDWLSVENQKNGTVEKEVLASCPEELTQFRRVLTSQLIFGMAERHLWLSLWERPAHSCFTRGQRVTCAALLLHLYLALGALWYGAVGAEGHSGPLSSHLLVNVETVAVGMTVAVLVFPLQCFLCFLFRKAPSQVTVDMSVPPSPVCQSVEMDVYLGQSALSGPSFLSLPDSSGPVRDSTSSLLESKALDSSILDFWAASGLAPQTDRATQDKGMVAWPSCDSLLNLPAGLQPTETTADPDVCKDSPLQGPGRQLRRKRALMQLHISSPGPPVSSTAHLPCTYSLPKDISSAPHFPDELGQKFPVMNPIPVQVHNSNLTTLLTASEEDLLMSIAAAAEETADATHSNSDSGWDSPRTTSSFSTMRSASCSSWSEQSDDKFLYGGEIIKPDLQSYPSLREAGLRKCPSVLSVDSVASTFLPSPSPDSARSSSTTRIGVVRGQPTWLLPPWALCVIYPLVAVLLGACLAVVGLYGSFFSRRVVLMWLISNTCAFLCSALLLEPLKVCAQALIYTVIWRPVDPEVEGQLAQETTVVRAFGEHSGKVRPLCGYGLLQAKEEARKVRALRSLMRHCVCQLLFLLLVLMVNYQDRIEQRQVRLLNSAVRRRLLAAPLGFPNLTSLRDWSDTEQWINHTLVPHLHQNPILRLLGLPQLRYTHARGALSVKLLGNNTAKTRQILADLHTGPTSKKLFKTLSVDFTHYHRESGLFLCVSVQLEQTQTRVTPFLSLHPLLIPSSSSDPDLQVALTILLLISALLILFGELWSMATERAQHLIQCCHWFQLFLALLSLATAVLQLCCLSLATSCVSKLRSKPDSFVDFHSAALLAQRSSQCAAVLLTLLVLKLLGTLRFVRRWVVIGRLLQRARGELGALFVLVVLLLLLCTHLGNTLFSRSVDGFLSLHQTSVSVLSILRGRMVLQRLCKVHPILGPLYGLLLMGGSVWLLARLCGVVLIRTYRAERAALFLPAIEPQDYEMVEFFIKRLKLWMGLTKAKQFRHRVKFEGMDIPPSRYSRESRLSFLSSTLASSDSTSMSSSFSSPRPLSSALSTRSVDSVVSEPGFEVQSYLDSLLPCVSAVLAGFDRVNQITEDIHNLEMKLEEVQATRRKNFINIKENSEGKFAGLEKLEEPDSEMVTVEVKHRRKGFLYPRPRISLPSSFSFTQSALQSSARSICVLPRTRSSFSESESGPVQPQPRGNGPFSQAAKPAPGIPGSCAGSSGFGKHPRRRAWHSGSSHSADAAQRAFQLAGVVSCRNGGDTVAFTSARPRSEEGFRRHIIDGVPVKRKAWIAEGPGTE